MALQGELLEPPPGEPRRRATWHYFERCVRDECQKVSNCTEGQNDQFNRSSFSLGQLVGTYDVYYGDVKAPFHELSEWARKQLMKAAAKMVNLDPARPWTSREIRLTLQSGWDAGMRTPHNGSPTDPFRGNAVTDAGIQSRALVPVGRNPLDLLPPTAEEARAIDATIAARFAEFLHRRNILLFAQSFQWAPRRFYRHREALGRPWSPYSLA